MKGPDRVPIDRYILPNKVLCSVAGMWPVDENSSSTKKAFAYFRIILTFAAASSVFVPEMMEIAVKFGDFKVLTGVGCVSTTVGQLLFKIIYLLIKRKSATRIYDELRYCWNVTDDSTDRKSFENFAYWAKIVTLCFYVSGMCTVLTFVTAATIDYLKITYNVSNNINAVRHLPFEVWYGTDNLESPEFEIAFIYQVVASFICCAGICGLNATFMTIILHICGQFKLIQTWICNIGTKMNNGIEHDDTSDIIMWNINRCIRHHQRIIHMVKNINDLLSPLIFAQLLTSGLEICLSGHAILTDAQGTDLLKYVLYLLSMLIQLCLWCWPAEILIHESEEIGNAIYFNIPWYNLPPLYQRQFCLTILRAQQYCHITALTFQTISARTLTNVFNTAASYFTLLRQIGQN